MKRRPRTNVSGTANDRFLLRRAAASPRGGVLFQFAPAIFSMIANAIDAANMRNIQIRIDVRDVSVIFHYEFRVEP